MIDTAITVVQLVMIGVAVGFGSPCFFVCAPLILPFVAAIEDDWKQALGDLCLVIGGRIFAYGILGAFAGISGGALHTIISSGVAQSVRIACGIIIIVLGLVIALGPGLGWEPCARLGAGRLTRGSLLLVGFVIGLAPCVPLISVMFEITLISRTPLAGVAYALCFGAGTACATLLTVGPLAVIFGHFPSRLFRNASLKKAFRVICGLLIMIFGIQFLFFATL